MKKSLLLTACLVLLTCLYAQPEKDLVLEGIELHDKGNFNAAIEKYDAALKVNPKYYYGHYEKAITLYALAKYAESLEIIRMILSTYPDHEGTAMLYSSYGNCYDMLKQPDKAIEAYNEGLARFPGTALLHFNKAITYYNGGKTAAANTSVQESIRLNPFHASSHNILAQVNSQNKVYSLMARLFMLAIEPNGARAAKTRETVEELIGANVKLNDDKSINITMSLPSPGDKPTMNDFHQSEIVMGMGAALNLDDKYKGESRPQRLKRNLEAIFGTMSPTKESLGFGWEFYQPFFHDLVKNKHLETFSHLVYSSADDAANTKWLADNSFKVQEFRTWFRAYFEA